MITINALSKSYNEVQALKNVSFNVNPGELFGLIGPDGAGKTTLFRILTTLIFADSGTATLNQFDVVEKFREIRQIIGYMPGRFSLYQDLSVEENLNFFATVFNTTINKNYDLIADIYKHIEPFKKRLAGQLSGGMKQKLALSCALIHKPKILVLDEPTTGVDAVSRMEFWQMLKRLQQKGITILVSTPYMDEASLCDRIALIQNGEIMDIDTPEQVVEKYPNKLYAITGNNNYELIKQLREYPNASSVFAFGSAIHFTANNEQYFSTDQLVDYLKNNGNQNIKIETITPTIEDCFMQLMAKNEA